MKPVVIGVSGPSGAGKSTLAKAIHARLDDAVTLQQDWYFKDPSECPPDANFCELRWLDVENFVRDAQALASGNRAIVPEIDFATFTRVGVRAIEPAPLVVIEGMTVFRIDEIDALCDLRYYVDEDFQTIAERKRLRDRTERDKDPHIIEVQLRWIEAEYLRDEGLRQRSDVRVLDSNAADLVLTDLGIAHS